MSSTEKKIPAIDFSLYLSENNEDRVKFIQELGDAFTSYGFASIYNHSIPQQNIDKFYSQIESFFNLDHAVKQKYEDPNNAGQRGYTSFGREAAKGKEEGDLKEFWQFGQYFEEGDPLGVGYEPNMEVDELPEFNQIGKNLYQSFEKIGADVLRALAEYLEIDKEYFTQHVTKGNSVLRPIFYPPITNDPKDAVRSAAHEDINLITLLVGASAEGLQVLDKDGEWIPVNNPENSLVINVGDMLQRHTNGVLKSTTHRVVNPPKEKWHTPRYSVPFFFHPREEMQLNVMDKFVTEERPKQWNDITAGEYLDERLKELGLK